MESIFTKKEPFIIFKHSPRCSISVDAHSEVKKYKGPFEIITLDVLKEPEFKMEVAERYGVQHESPQILFIVNQKCKKHFSHYEVTLENLNKLD